MTDEIRYFEASEIRFSQTQGEAGEAGAATLNEERMEGYAIVFNSPSQPMLAQRDGRTVIFREFIAPGAARRSVEDAERGAHMILALWSHDKNQPPIGSTKDGLRIEIDEIGVRFSLDIKRMDPQQIATVRAGEQQMSFGFRTNKEDDQWVRQPDGTYNRTVHNMALNEISVVITPAYQASSVGIRAADEAALDSLEAWEARQAEGEAESAGGEPEAAPVDEEPTETVQMKKLERLKKLAEFHAK
ncbi:HK97 family phage prohead protease [Brevundimonas sp. M1A4_2e]